MFELLTHWTPEKVGTWGINFFTVVEGVGLGYQIRTIWKNRSGRSVSGSMTLFFVVMFSSCIVYGLTYHRLPVVFNGSILGLGFLFVAVGLALFKGYTRWEKAFGLILIGLLALMLLSAHRDQWYFGFSVASAGVLLLQPWEIWRNKSAGDVDPRLLLMFFGSNTFWVVYAFAVRDWVLMSLCPFYVVIVGLAIVLWWIYRPRDQRAT